MTEISSDAMIAARGLTKYFGAFVAIKDISFSIPRGQIVAFVGPNGAGKSTTMKILSGFMAASEGSAYIAGLEITANRIEAARRLGYLPENGPLYRDMTPIELLRFFGGVRGLNGRRLADRIDAVVELAAIRQVLEKPIGKLSRGYCQRVGVAQALLHDPEVLIMDEPTAGLDPNQIRDFRTNISRLRETKTIMISTHILQEVEAVADRVLFIHNGGLLFDGSPGDLRKGVSLEQAFYELTDYGRAAAPAAKEGANEA
ncbi:MAG: ABC transporter ATP-binding protein [candidate division Zixibacteria bacterium]|nr:ABC transporter ATP-binding protein [candidate division Zixibacteria bacterium]